MLTATKEIAQFVAECKPEDIPAEVMDKACQGITDFIGVALAGCKEEPSRIIADYIKRMDGTRQASIIGYGLETSLYPAALANGTIGHALDYDDMAISFTGHPSVFLVPTILALGENTEASGEDMLFAYVVGYETACNIAIPLAQSHYVQGWHNTATFGTLGAAAAAARLLRLETHEVQMALGIAASLAGGLRQNFGTMTKPLHAGKAAANGIQAALLAQAGFTADDSIIEAPLGFGKVFGHNEEIDWTTSLENLGKTFFITSPVGLSIKPYPSCGFTHCAIDAALYIKKEHRVNTDDIAEVELGVSPFDKQILIHHRPRTGLEGKFSLEYCVARALLSGEVRLRHFTDGAVAEPQAKDLMERMKWVEKYPMPVMGTPEGFGTKSVTVRLKDGRKYSKVVAIAKGMPQNPLTPDEFKSKYRDCASAMLAEREVESSFSLLTNLREIKQIKKITEIIAKK